MAQSDTDPTMTPRTLDEETLKPPTSRVGNGAAILTRIGEMRRDDSTRARRRTIMQRLYDGEKPFSESKLRAKGQSDRTNINWREAEGMVDQAKTPYYSVVFRQSRHANIRIAFGTNAQLWDKWSDIISENFHWMLSQWKSHSYQVQLRDFQMCFYGIGIPVFTDLDSPLWETRKIGEVLVPKKTPADIEQVTEATFFREIDPVKLYGMIDRKGATTEGWFPERVKRAILKKSPRGMQKDWGETWGEQYAASLRRGDVQWNANESMIAVADYVVKEFNGKVTRCIVLDNGTVGDTNAAKDDDVLLFKKEGYYDCFSQAMQPFFFDIGTGEWHSIKGLGPKIRDFCEVSNRFLCWMVDGAKIGAGILLKATDGTALQKTQLVEVSGANIIQPGFDVVQNRIAESLQGPLAVQRELDNKRQNNTGQYLQRVSNENAEPTLGQAQINEQNQSQLNESSLDRHMCSLDWLYYEQARRAFTLGKRLYARHRDRASLPPGENYPSLTEGERLSLGFYRRCIDDGVPEQAMDFDYIESVKATRGIGGGSPAAVDYATQQGMTLLPMLNERGRNIVMGMRVARLFGQAIGREIVPPFDTANIPTNEAALATLENNALRMPTGEALVAYDQDHLTHFDIHFQDVAEHVQMLRAGQAQPMEVLIHLHNFGPHARKHLNHLVGDPTREQQLKQREAAWLSISKIADQLQQNIEESMRSQQANQPPAQPDPKAFAEMMKVHGNLMLKEKKQDGDMALKQEKQQFSMRMKDLETAHTLRLKNVTAAAQQPGSTAPEPAPNKVAESISYKDAPPSVRRQMERQAGMIPATEAEVSPQAAEPSQEPA